MGIPFESSSIADAGTRSALLRIIASLDNAIPSDTYQFVTVSFPTANTDVVIPTNLRPPNPEGIYYMPVDYLGPPPSSPSIYRDVSVTRKAWGTGFIVLRCNTSPLNVVLLLITKR